MSEHLEKIAVFDNHAWHVIYPERFNWTTPEEAAYDFITWNQVVFLTNFWTHAGLACSCHSVFGEYCVIELVNGIVDKGIHEHSTLKNVYAGSGRNKFYSELDAEVYPTRFSDPIAYMALEQDFIQAMERDWDRDLKEFDPFGEKLLEFAEAYPDMFSGINTWWVSGVEDWQFIYDHLDDYNKFKIKQWYLPSDPVCFSHVTENIYCE